MDESMELEFVSVEEHELMLMEAKGSTVFAWCKYHGELHAYGRGTSWIGALNRWWEGHIDEPV